MIMWWCVLCCVLVAGVCSADDVKEVKTSQGVVRGHKDPSGVYAFYGIPYATAPIGAAKFRAPLPGPAWLRPLDAVDKGIVCTQIPSPFVSNKVMSDDCLIASVYVPDTDEKNLPVAVYVHGGAFQMGYGDMIPPINFVKNKNIVAVTFNYRLGVNGFLCLGTPDAPGNAGMKDQLALLRWVKKNIASFGGNPDDVTIIGGSAGSVSVDLLMLSKTTKGLFTKVIPESGAAVGTIALQVDPLQYAKVVASKLGFNDIDDVYALEKFFQETPSQKYFENLKLFQPNSTFGFVPCVERDTGAEMFLEDAPVTIIKSGKYKKLPMLFGFADMEGLLQVPSFVEWKELMNENFSEFLPVDLQFQNEEDKQKLAQTVKEFYFGDKPIVESSILGYINFFSDIAFAYPTIRETKLHTEAGHNQIYLYEYSFVDENTQVVPYTDNVRGAKHCQQTIDVLGGRRYINPADTNESQEYKAMQAVLQDIWYNFITTGKPVPENSSLPQWPAAGADSSPHMSLGKQLELRGPLLKERAQFWEGVYAKYYRVPVPPPTPPTRHTEL